MSIVIENLKEAIIGESTAKRKYELFDKKAQDENLPEIAYLFQAISFAESIHIKTHAKALSKITNDTVDLNEIVKLNENEIKSSVGTTRDNLTKAIEGETFEFKKMYKSFIKNSRKEEVYLAEFSFNLARKAEIVHNWLFKNYLKKLNKDENFNPVDIYVCTICGNVELERAPDICPNCKHDYKFFKKM